MEESRVRYSKLSMMTATKRFSICGGPGGRGWGRARAIQTHIHGGPEGEAEGDERGKGDRESDGGRAGRKHTCAKEPRQRDGEMEMWGETEIKMETESQRERGRRSQVK